MDNVFDTPILFIVFNRPKYTEIVFKKIKKLKPKKLYISQDGPRINNPTDKDSCDKVRSVISTIDWDCDVQYNFFPANVGCRIAVSNAINWFFSNEEYGIILEDDCLPDISFFLFCEQMLKRYKDVERIKMISGNCFHKFHPESLSVNNYYYSHYAHIWGWATWRRAWQEYDIDMREWDSLKNTDWLIKIGNYKKDFAKYWTWIFNLTEKGLIGTWDYQLQFSVWGNNGLSIVPSVNLCQNIGFGKESTHTKFDYYWFTKIPVKTITLPFKGPENIERDFELDRFEDIKVHRTKQLVLFKIKKILKPFINKVIEFIQHLAPADKRSALN